MTLKAVLFDAVGTVIHPDPSPADVYYDVGRRFGSSLTREQIAARFRAAFERHITPGEETDEPREVERWRRIVGDAIDDVGPRGERVFQTLWNHFATADAWRTFADVPAALNAVRGLGLRTAIASNFDERVRSIMAGQPALSSLEIFVSSELGCLKPDLRFFRRIEEKLKLAANEILLVGDDWRNDVEGGVAAGWRVVWVDRRGADARRLHGMERIESLEELPAVLLGERPV